MTNCPKCGLRQWNYDEATLTCKGGHRFPVGEQPIKRGSGGLILATACIVAPATLALDFFVRTIT